jgi:hypothetical protein
LGRSHLQIINAGVVLSNLGETIHGSNDGYIAGFEPSNMKHGDNLPSKPFRAQSINGAWLVVLSQCFKWGLWMNRRTIAAVCHWWCDKHTSCWFTGCFLVLFGRV